MRRKVQDSIIILWCNNYHSQRAIFTHTPTKSCLNIGGLNDWAGLAPQLLGGSSLKAYRSLRLWFQKALSFCMGQSPRTPTVPQELCLWTPAGGLPFPDPIYISIPLSNF